MASKKEHKRKQKNRTPRKGDEDNPFLLSGAEINSLDLLSTLYAIPKATEGGAAAESSGSADFADKDAEVAEMALREATEKARREAEEAEQKCREEEARHQAEEEERRRQEAEAAEKARREAEEAELKRREEEARRQAEEEERRRQEAEAAEKVRREAEEAELKRCEEEARRQAEEEERRRQEAEAAEKARREAEEDELKRREEEARRQAEEEERRRQEEEAAEKARREAEEAERKRREEEARRQAEEEERRRQEAEAAEKARLEAEEAERKRCEEEAAALARQAEEVRRRAEEEEQRRREREAEKARLEAEQAERARRDAEEAERRRQEVLAAERARALEEEAERARRMTEQIEKAKAEAEADAAERGRRRAEEELARQEALAAERARQLAAEASRRPDGASERMVRAASGGETVLHGVPAVPSAPPIEVENPYWQKPPEIFDVLSGAPHGARTPDYAAASGGEASIPVTMVQDSREARLFAPPGSFVEDEPDGEGRPGSMASYAVPPEKRMYIVMVTPEVAPAAKVGGLGDVILGLGRELMKRGHGVEVICPMYSGMRYDLISDLHEEYGELWCPHYNEWRAEKVFQGKVGGELQVNFITGGAYTERPNIYGYDDDLQRFAYFSRAALEFMYKTNRRPEIIHCHDWATGLVPAILWDIYEKLGWNNSRCVYTIHNNECQGLCGFGDKLLGLVGLDVKNYMRPDRMQDDTHKNCINMMKGGIVYSNFVTTVSPTYAGELKSAAGGRGLQTTIAKNSAKVGGVLNGIDYETWNPVTDAKLAARYSSGDDFFEKYKNKTALREWLGLWDAWRPIIAVVTRLTHQKGLDLIKHAIYSTQSLQAQFVLLGSAPDPKVNSDFVRMQHELRDNHDINLYLGYHEDLSHLIYAGADMFLVPSLYEPCGLTQMISLRYGTVPIVRETGGLVDTVFDLDNSGLGLNEANGYTFRDPTPISLDYGLERAVRLWYDNPDAFNRLARNGMRYDYSWRHPTEHYENIYNYVKA